MARFIEPIEKLVYQLSKLPGVGNKTAQRYALSILAMSNSEVDDFVNAIAEAKNTVKQCSVCGNFTDSDPCAICSTRTNNTICIVKEARDVLAIERLGEYKGVYHVLGGLLDPLHGVGVDDINLKGLFSRLGGDVSEVIVALDSTTEGEATTTYLARILRSYNIKTTRLKQGMSIGSELQYTDDVTLSKALSNRETI